MAGLSKYLTVCLVILLVVTSTILLTVNAQTILTPTIPEFSVKYSDNSFYAPTPTRVYDQYGNFQILQGYIDNRTVDFAIKNQPFTAYTIPYNPNDPTNTGQTVHLMYNIRMKSASYNDWEYITHLSDGYLAASNSSQTLASFQISNLFALGIPNDDVVSFQLQALIGYVHRYPVIASWTFNGTKSDWSDTQTITIPANPTTPTNTPSTTPTSTNSISTYLLLISITLVVIAILLAVIIALLFYRRNRKKANLKQ